MSTRPVAIELFISVHVFPASVEREMPVFVTARRREGVREDSAEKPLFLHGVLKS
jgi:hypothetical protein